MSIDSGDVAATSPSELSAVDRQRLEERRSHGLRDLDELAGQVAAGEVDEGAADVLRAGYLAELGAIEQALQASTPVPPGEERSSRRALMGALILIGAFTLMIVFASNALRQDSQPAESADVGSAGPIDNATLEQMEEVLAANPDLSAMRVALADVYFGQGEYLAALNHYVVLASTDLAPEVESEVLGRIGWMAYLTGQNEAAVGYLTSSLEVDPDHAEGKLFLGFVRLYGMKDPDGAIPLLEEVLEDPNAPPATRVEVEAALADARAGIVEAP